MNLRLEIEPIEKVDADILVIPTFENESAEAAKELNEKTAGWLADIHTSGEFSGKLFETAVLHRSPGFKAKRLAVAGAGKRDQFNPSELRKVAGAVIRAFKPKGARHLALALDRSFATPEFITAAVEGAILGGYEPDSHKTDVKEKEKAVETLTVIVPPGTDSASLTDALERGRIVAESQNFSRELANEPANLMTPTTLAGHAREMAAEQGLECEVLDGDHMLQLGMGSLMGVSQGSAEPPALIIIRYRPANAPKSPDHLALIGKGVTFDTGGVSIKPADGMEKMKYDMAGGAAVIGAMRAIAQLKPAIPVTAFIPAVENMVSSRAQRPGDIVTSLSGKTIEVLNTDAEGRLILIDAITYARRLGCTHMIDAATLTGAIVVALGHVHSGAFTNDDALLNRVLGAARAEGEKLWPMPLDDEYKESLKSAFADIPNIGAGRWGGAITAAIFLKEFVENTPWVHLDIAGTAWLDDAKPFLAKGPSGVCVRTFVNVALNW